MCAMFSFDSSYSLHSITSLTLQVVRVHACIRGLAKVKDRLQQGPQSVLTASVDHRNIHLSDLPSTSAYQTVRLLDLDLPDCR